GNAGVEVPAALKIVRHPLDRLVKFALNGTSLGREIGRDWVSPCRVFGMSVTREETEHASQKSLNAFDTGLLPIEIAVGRCSEQTVHARGVGAEARDHFVG